VCLTVVSALWVVFFGASAFGYGSGELDGRAVAPQAFFARAGAMLLSLGILGLVLAFGLWRHKRWARPLAVATCALVPIVLALPDQESRRALGQAAVASVVATGVVALYFYAEPRVRAYYAQLAIDRAARPGA
jgi:uncharacterized membrane protein (DUF2068 family)